LSNPLLVDDVAARHSDLVRIIAHMGHPWQLLAGSGYPMWTPTEAVDKLRELARSGAAGLPRVGDETLDWLLNGNPLAALGLGA
jgi:predicted TIM-barrel fold metal-dependent hydrolase